MTKSKKSDTSKQTYQQLFSLSKEISILESVSNLLEWDQETCMPKEGHSLRSDQLSLMASLLHKKTTSSKFRSHLENLVDLKEGKILAEGLSLKEKANVRQWRRDYLIASALPNNFVKHFAKLASESMQVWTDARKNNAFKDFLPYLTQIFEMSREKAEYLGYKNHPYDALCDSFEPHMTIRELEGLFIPLRLGIREILDKILEAPQVDDSFLHGKFPEEKQIEFGRKLLLDMGYDPKRGRLDLSTHPFCTSLHPSDNRITTRIHATSVFDCISTILHEGGHALYEMGLIPEYYGSPLCEAISLGIHESQSRFWETFIGQSKPFWKGFLPKLKATFKPKLDKVTLESFYRGINKVSPSFIRVESDEVTYCLHVILRFELEKSLIEGSLSPADLPEAWNNKMKELLGIVPKDDTHGCLQDVHWSMGAIGYFPTYALGNLYAAQFFNAFAKDYPSWGEKVSKGELLFIKEWLGDKIHQHGRSLSSRELVKKVTGSPLSTAPYLDYLEAKYSSIYRF